MNTTTPAIRGLARRLVALEAARDPSDGPAGAAARACEALRVPLARLVGVAGFRSLLSRALARARAEVPALDAARVTPDGSLEGLDGAGPDQAQAQDAGAAVVVQLLGLLVIFIGEPLTMGLVRDAWPDASGDETDRGGEGRP